MRKRIAILLAIALTTTALVGQSPETRQVEVFSHKISYIEAGSGAPVILLHGMGGSKSAWALAIPGLAAKFHVYVPDQIGFGASDKPLLKYRVATYADFLHEFMRKLGIAKASIVGNSMGGWVAADFAIRYPDGVDRLVLVDSGGYFIQPLSRKDLQFLNPGTLDATRELVRRVFFNKQLHNEAFVSFMFAERMRAGDAYTIDRLLDSAVEREDALNGRLRSIRAPVLVIHGRQDPLIPLANADLLVQEIAGAKKVVLDNCGHVPPFECPAAFEKAVTEFLSAEIK